MTTILILNAVSSLVAATGLAGIVARRRRRAKRANVQRLYIGGR